MPQTPKKANPNPKRKNKTVIPCLENLLVQSQTHEPASHRDLQYEYSLNTEMYDGKRLWRPADIPGKQGINKWKK